MGYATTKFEVSGKVQGFFFRKYTKAKAVELGLVGWCKNTPCGTVEGEFEYEVQEQNHNEQQSSTTTTRRWGADAFRQYAFRYWLSNTGPPHSRIDGCSFSEEVISDVQRFDRFRVVR